MGFKEEREASDRMCTRKYRKINRYVNPRESCLPEAGQASGLKYGDFFVASCNGSVSKVTGLIAGGSSRSLFEFPQPSMQQITEVPFGIKHSQFEATSLLSNTGVTKV
jgi:hypothetical protein